MRRAIERFEGDYWGLAYRAGYEYILAGSSGPIKVYVPNLAGKHATLILPDADPTLCSKFLLMKSTPPVRTREAVKINNPTIRMMVSFLKPPNLQVRFFKNNRNNPTFR